MLPFGTSRGRRPGARRPPARGVRLAVPALLACALASACAEPEYRFVASEDAEIVIKVPRSWSLVREGAPGTDPTTQPEPEGAWFAVYDGDRKPDIKHLNWNSGAAAPVALARTWVVQKEQAGQITGDTLRNIVLPVTPTARAAGAGDPQVASFKLLRDEDVRSRTAQGAHVVYSYDLQNGTEVFDQIVMLDSRKTRLHLFIVHCSKACYDANSAEITKAVNSFTVKIP